MDVQPPHIARKVAERIECGASTYGNYRRGLCVLRSNYKRHGYRYIRDVLSHYLNTGDWKQTELPALTARQIAYNDAYKQKNAADEKRLAEIEDRSKTAYAWVGRVQLTAQRSTAECVRLDKRIDFVDKAVNQRCDHQDELIIALRQRLNGLAEANKHLLEKLAAATEPTPDATPHVELAQWWERWWSR